MKIVFSSDEIQAVAKKILERRPRKVILFYGEMGVGKTTLIKALVKALGIHDTTNSPTFSLVNEYEGEDDTVYHFDFYRLNHETEAYDMGVEEYLYSGHWCFVEWAEKIPTLIPQEHSTIRMATLPTGQRELEFV